VAVAIEYGGLLLLLLAFVVAYGMLMVHRGIFQPIILKLAELVDSVSIDLRFRKVKPLGFIAAFLRSAAATIDHGLGALVLATEKGAVTLWHGLAAQVKWLGQLLGDLAETIEHRFHRLLLLFPPAVALWATVRAVQQLPKLWHEAQKAAHRAAAAYSAVVESDAWVRGRFRTGERSLSNLAKRVRAHGRTLAGAGAAALVATALARLGLSWLRCPRVASAGKRLCGLDHDLLASLLADTLIVASSVSLVEFAHELQSVTTPAASAIRGFVREA
jgi:hypothetical protein